MFGTKFGHQAESQLRHKLKLIRASLLLISDLCPCKFDLSTKSGDLLDHLLLVLVLSAIVVTGGVHF